MTIVGVLSDSHVFDSGRRKVPQAVFDLFADAQLILHGGDIVAWSLIEELERVAPVLAVRGNNDPPSDGLPRTRRVTVEEAVIGLAHGDVGRTARIKALPGITGNGITAANALSHFNDQPDVGCIVFGHSHNPLLHRIEHGGRELLLLNPGSPTDRRYSPHFGCAKLHIDGATIRPELFVWQ